MKTKKNIFFIAIAIFILSTSFYAYYRYGIKENSERGNEEVINQVESPFSQDELRNCKDLLRRIIVGNWRYMESGPVLILKNDNRFQLKDFGSTANITEGRWELGSSIDSIVLKFDDLDSNWERIFNSDELYDSPGLMVAANKAEKLIEFEIKEYGGIPKDFEGKCVEDKFYINILNAFYYKII